MTIQLHGKEYVEVKDRVAAAHLEDSYSMLKEETFAMGGREYVRVYIDVRGKQYIGTAECKYNAPPKSPDGMSPFECGETSALGRALGFAGYGVVDSIASADEVVSNQQNGNRQQAAQSPQPVDPAHIRHQQEVQRKRIEPALVQLSVGSLFEIGKAEKWWPDADAFYQRLSELFGKKVTRETVRTLTQAELTEASKQLYEQIPAGVTGAN